MKAYIYLKDEKSANNSELLAVVDNLEVVPRGIYVVDGKSYQYSGTPTFHIEKQPYLHGGQHHLTAVHFTVEKVPDPSDEPVSKFVNC